MYESQGRGRKRPGWVQVPLLAGIGFWVVLALAAGSVAAAGAWSGSGTLSFTSTPSHYGPCTGSGTSSIVLSGGASSLQGTLDLNLQTVSSVCQGYFTTGPISDSVSGYMSGSTLYLSDSYGNAISGQLSGGALTLSFTTTAHSGGGGTCVEYCTTVYTMQMTGSGPLGASSLFGGGTLGPDAVLGGMGIAVGVASVAVAASSAAPLRIPAPGLAPPPATSGFPWVSFSEHFGSLTQIPPGAVRQDAPPPGRHLSRPPNGGRCRACQTPLLYTTAGWFCPNPLCPLRDQNAMRTTFPGPGQHYGMPAVQAPKV